MLFSPNDNRNLRKYIFDSILKIFKESNFRTLGHLTKIYLHCWGSAETFLCNYHVKPKLPGEKQKDAREENARPQKYCFRNVTALAEILLSLF